MFVLLVYRPEDCPEDTLFHDAAPFNGIAVYATSEEEEDFATAIRFLKMEHPAWQWSVQQLPPTASSLGLPLWRIRYGHRSDDHEPPIYVSAETLDDAVRRACTELGECADPHARCGQCGDHLWSVRKVDEIYDEDRGHKMQVLGPLPPEPTQPPTDETTRP